jgi:competence protein ComEA
MTSEERRTVTFTAALLLLASLIRFAWEVRPVPPVLPPEGVPAELVEETRRALEMEERRRTPLAPGERVDPNRDPEVELARLPGIGPAMAARIAESRDRDGPFARPDDLLRVPGIGPATLERIRALLDLDRVPEQRASAAGGGADASPRPGLEGRVDVNRAGRDELTELPGIGPALADRILEHRLRSGPFRSADELLEVPGIGPSTLERLRPLVRVAP